MRFDNHPELQAFFDDTKVRARYEDIQRGVRELSAALNKQKGPFKTKLFRNPRATQAVSTVAQSSETRAKTAVEEAPSHEKQRRKSF